MVRDMNREEFLRQLELLLSGISEEERQDAMEFYRSYFEEAEGSDEDVIAELESPQKAAESILKNLGIEGNGSYYNSYANRDEEYYRNLNNTVNNMNGAKKDASSNVWMVLLLVFTSPLWLTLVLAAACVLLAAVISVFAVAVAAAAVMAALIIAGFVLVGTGFSFMFGGGAAVGFGLVGAGLLLLALGVLAVVLVVWTFGWFLPWALKGIWKLCKMPFEHRKGIV